MNYFSAPGIIRPKQIEYDSPERILKSLSNYLRVPEVDIIGNSRKCEIVYARHLYCFIARERCAGESLSNIGKLIGRDHATVLHAMKKIRDYIDVKHKRGALAKELLKTI